MQDLYEGIELTPQENQAVVRGLLDLADVDGAHETEMALIADFAGIEDPAALAAIRKTPFDLAATVKTLTAGGSAKVEAFLMSAYMLIYADGHHSDRERARIAEYAKAMGVAADRLAHLHTQARLYLLQMLAANLRNKAAVLEVAAELGLGENDLAGLKE